MSSSRKKQSIIAGALTGTAGIFFTKALGLLYASPFQAMAGNEMIFYTSTYQIYDYLLTISLSGIPFAIASLVAKYVAKEDYKTALMVRKISGFMLGCFGICIFALVNLFSGQIAGYLGAGREAVYLQKLQTSIILVSFAFLTVPILSYFRGFYQGMKEVKVYAFSQVLEQLVRVTFLLSMGALLVYIFHHQRIWAVYFAVLSASVAALISIVHFLFFDRKHLPQIQRLAQEQKGESKTKKEIFVELLYYAIPYLLIGAIANCSGMINLMFVNRSLQTYGYAAQEADIIYSVMNFNAYKLVSIPQIIGPGFAVAIIPHITAALAVEDYEATQMNIQKVYTSCTYLVYPIILLMILYAKEIYFVMYGNANLQIGMSVLRWALLTSCFWIIMNISSNIMLALKLKRVTLVWNILTVVLLFLTIGSVVSRFSYPGMYMEYLLIYVVYSLMCFMIMKYKYQVSFTPIFKTMAKSVLCLVAIVGVYVLLSFLPIDFIAYGRVVTLFGVGIECVVAVCAYVALSYVLKLPQTIFDMDFERLKGVLKRHAA